MFTPPISFKQLQRDTQQMDNVPITKVARRLLWKSALTEIGQWYFTQDEMELINLYMREGTTQKFSDLCLLSWQGNFATKGVHYFKEYPKRYGPKQYFATLEELAQILDKTSLTTFEEEDQALKLKMLLSINEEILNHIAWGLYLAYQAGGIRKDFCTSISLREFHDLHQQLLLAAELYLALFISNQPPIASWCRQVQKFIGSHPYRFIANLANNGTRGNNGSFFRLRWGGHEIANVLHALKIKAFAASNNLQFDVIVAPFYAGITCGALAYVALQTIFPKLEYWLHVYSVHEDHVRCGEWEKTTKREISQRISQIPAIVRPQTTVNKKNILLLSYALEDGKVLEGLNRYYRQLEAGSVYLSAVEGDNAQLSFTDHSVHYKDLALVIPPSFTTIGIAPWRHQQKLCKSAVAKNL